MKTDKVCVSHCACVCRLLFLLLCLPNVLGYHRHQCWRSNLVQPFVAFEVFSRVEWTNKKLDDWNPAPTKSCLLIGTQKIVKTFSKILLSSALYQAKKLKKYHVLSNMIVLLLQFFYMQLPDCSSIYRWKELLKWKRMTYYLSIYVFIW